MKIHKVKCPVCGEIGKIRNFKGTAQYQGNMYLVSVESHAVPVCMSCGALMEEKK